MTLTTINSFINMTFFKNRHTRNEFWVILGLVIAVVVPYSIYYLQEPNEKHSGEPKNGISLGISENDGYINNPKHKKVQNKRTVAIAITDDTQNIDHEASEIFSSIMRKRGIAAVSSLFSSKFFSDGIFDLVYGGQFQVLNELNIEQYCDYIILGKGRTQFFNNNKFNNLITVKYYGHLLIISALHNTQLKGLSISASGVGFDQQAALLNLEENITTSFPNKIFASIN